MILLNLFFLKNTVSYSRNFSTHAPYTNNKTGRPQAFVRRNFPLAYILKTPEILSHTNQNLAKKKIIKHNAGRNLFNKLWSQEIFISVNSKFLKKYDFNLNSLNINNRQNIHKSLVSKFSRSLFNGSIQTSFMGDMDYSKDNLSSIQYLWDKSIKLQLLKIRNIFYASTYHQDLKSIQSTLRKDINLNHLPLFTISNHLGQMVISEPPTDLNISSYVKLYSSTPTWDSNRYYGFFFTNYKDAQEYMLNIQRYYNLENSSLRIFTCSFSSFYRIMDKFSNNICFRLIPDLKEVSELIKKYRHHRNVSFHKNQSYSKNYFQGQPLYIIKNGHSNFSYDFPQQEGQKYNLVFVSYNDAMQVCGKLTSQWADSSTSKLRLVVYNLEHFIQDQRKLDNGFTYPYLVIPSKASYLFTKKYHLKNNQQLFYSNCLDTISFISLWSKRIFWSLTSRKP